MFVHQVLRKLARENKLPVNCLRKGFGAHKGNGETTKQALKSLKSAIKSFEGYLTNDISS